MTQANAFYAQSGGVTAVINTTAAAVIETIAKHPNHINKLFVGHCGITGALNEDLIDMSYESKETINQLKYTPASAFGSCRFKLKNPEKDEEQFKRLLEVFAAHNIHYFFYNGGGDSQDTTAKIAAFFAENNYPLTCIGIPKTVDNDLPLTDCSPGFASAGKYLATAIFEASLDVAAMAKTSTKVFILETMGRHSGWLAASCGVASRTIGEAPHMILFPEIAFDPKLFLQKVAQTVKQYGFCSIVVSEGIKDGQGNLLVQSDFHNATDAFGHEQLAGVAAPLIAHLIKKELGFKYHWAIPDYLQRCCGHLVSQVDREHAYAVGKAAVEMAIRGESGVMPIIVRTSTAPYTWHVDKAPLNAIANIEKPLPKEYISEDGYHISQACRDYLQPLFQGESYPEYQNGLPAYAKLKKVKVEKCCETLGAVYN